MRLFKHIKCFIFFVASSENYSQIKKILNDFISLLETLDTHENGPNHLGEVEIQTSLEWPCGNMAWH